MNLGVMRTEVRDIVGELTADFWTNAELNRYINEAQRRFHGEVAWPWLITEGTATLGEGDSDLELGDGIDFNRNINVTLTVSGETRSYQPVRVSPTKGFQLRSMYSTNWTATRPQWFYIASIVDQATSGLYTTTARFVPTPVGDMDVDYQYFRVVDDMSDDTDVPDAPVEYHKGFVHYAAGTAWLKELNGAPKAQEQFELYNKVLEQAKREFFTDPDDTPVVMGKDEPQYSLRHPVPDPWLSRMPETLGP